MSNSDIKEYYVKGGSAKVTFSDGSDLVLIPYRNWGNIEGFDSAVLYQSGVLEALATERPSRYARHEESGFWSKGRVTQPQLAEYWNTAVTAGNRVYEEYNARRITEDDWVNKFWEFWMISHKGWITRQNLEQEQERVFDRNPGRFEESIPKDF